MENNEKFWTTLAIGIFIGFIIMGMASGLINRAFHTCF
jgi:hypothetical protein